MVKNAPMKDKNHKKNDTKKAKPPGNFVKAKRPLLQLNKNGGVQKSKRPVSALTVEANKKARLAFATGDLAKDELARKTQRDLRSLYIRFKAGISNAPKTDQDIFALDKSIKDVRIPRQGKAKEKKEVKYCFVEFENEKTCEAMKEKLAANPDFVVDFVGVKSKGSQESKMGKKMPLNPVRLHVSGFGSNKVTAQTLERLFPKSKSAVVPEKSSGSYGLVTFNNPGEAKAAYDAANQLKLESEDGSANLTVTFARMAKRSAKPLEAGEAKKAKKAKKSLDVKDVKDLNDEEDKEEEAASENEDQAEKGDVSSDEIGEVENDEEDSDEIGDVENDEEDSDEKGEVENDEEDSDEEEEVENDQEEEEDDDDDE